MSYIVLSDLKTYLGIDSAVTQDDVILHDSIDRARAFIDNYTDTVFDVSSLSTRYFDFTRYSDRELLFDYWLATTTDLVVTNGDGTTVPSSNYVMLERNRVPYYGLEIKRYSTSYFTYENSPESAIGIEGYWGWSQTAPNDIIQANIRLASYLYRQKDAQIFDSTSFSDLGRIVEINPNIPQDITVILDRYMTLG